MPQTSFHSEFRVIKARPDSCPNPDGSDHMHGLSGAAGIRGAITEGSSAVHSLQPGRHTAGR